MMDVLQTLIDRKKEVENELRELQNHIQKVKQESNYDYEQYSDNYYYQSDFGQDFYYKVISVKKGLIEFVIVAIDDNCSNDFRVQYRSTHDPETFFSDCEEITEKEWFEALDKVDSGCADLRSL